MTILVTGGAGFIGANYVLQQRRTQDELVLNLDKLTYAGNLATLSTLQSDAQHIFVQGDIGDRALVQQLLEQYQPRALLNFAAETHVDRSIDGPDAFIQTNILGTFHLLEATRSYWQSLQPSAQENFRFLHISTDEVFGTLGPDDPPFLETTAYAPNSPYSASKASSDHLVRSYFHTYNLPTLITNCSNNYGPHQFPEKLIPLMILNALEGKALPIYGDGQNIRDWLFVEDHCRAIDQVLTTGRPGETYNIGGGAEKPNIWLVKQICAILDELAPESEFAPHSNLMTFVQDRPGHDRRYAIDFRKINQELGWSPQVTIESGLRQTVQWYLANRAWCQAVTANQYERQRLGLASSEK
ncbi:dTDP-glucose 4,6-dehydratase [Acaryochloris sp. IP29b_bin.148]|uniref:dTDP-glucose 4,6-dehydratase n=1 Tax=Acaryochloris sp. IP29b_bin.148 TaxID=2969218 RepID=UPI0026331830|nr:dTDP-glucose 4,6-dehydratase [Acaryochloris sp. IP29b_bin.148]